MKRQLLILSHLALAALGGWLAFSPGPQEAPPTPVAAKAPATPAPSDRPPPPADKPALPGKLALATPGAWRAVWEEALLKPRSNRGEPQMPDPIGFFMDWCEADPEGVIHALSKTYAPGFDHNFLNNASQRKGAIIAPALVKHYRELTLRPRYEVEFAMGKSLNALAVEDPARAAALTSSLPAGVRSEVYTKLFEKQSRDNLDRLLAGLPADVDAEEARRRSEAFAAAVDHADPKRGALDGMAQTTDSALRKAYAAEAVLNACRDENWTEFFDSVGRLDSAAQEEVRAVMKFRSPSEGYPEKIRTAVSAECRRLGLDDWSR